MGCLPMMEEQQEKKHTNRYKSLLVILYLLKHADDENPVPIDQIQAHLSKYGIEAERKGIYSDIADFVDLLNTEQDDDNEIAEHDKLKYAIKYTRKPYPTSKKGGYLVTSRPYSFDELKLLTELSFFIFLNNLDHMPSSKMMENACGLAVCLKKEKNLENTELSRFWWRLGESFIGDESL